MAVGRIALLPAISVATLAISVAALAISVAAAAPQLGRTYRNEAARVRIFEPPSAWQPAPQTSYPQLLVAYTHADGGRITLTTQKLPPGADAASLAAAAAPNLEKQGYSDIRRAADPLNPDRARLDARLDSGRRFLKQLYVVDGAQAWVVTLVASTVNQPLMARDFETAARSLVIVPQETADGGAR
jgi:hypothetical protein